MAIPLLVPELSSALKEDSDAQAKVSDDIVGIDFDPFLNSQDPCGRYDVGTTRLRAGRYRVAVHAVCDGARDQRPSVVVELTRAKAGWVIFSIHDPRQASDLRSVLRSLRASRNKGARLRRGRGFCRANIDCRERLASAYLGRRAERDAGAPRWTLFDEHSPRP